MKQLKDVKLQDNILIEGDVSTGAISDNNSKVPTNAQVKAYAVSYIQGQTLTPEQAAIALQNLGLEDASTIHW